MLDTRRQLLRPKPYGGRGTIAHADAPRRETVQHGLLRRLPTVTNCPLVHCGD